MGWGVGWDYFIFLFCFGAVGYCVRQAIAPHLCTVFVNPVVRRALTFFGGTNIFGIGVEMMYFFARRKKGASTIFGENTTWS